MLKRAQADGLLGHSALLSRRGAAADGEVNYQKCMKRAQLCEREHRKTPSTEGTSQTYKIVKF